jgi:hypothetical protein
MMLDAGYSMLDKTDAGQIGGQDPARRKSLVSLRLSGEKIHEMIIIPDCSSKVA